MTDQTPPYPSPGDPADGAPPAYPSPQPGGPEPGGYPGQFPPGQPAYGTPYAYGSPYPSRFQPPPSTAMSSWALALAILICIPFAFVVSIGLAIAVLVRSREDRDYGKKRAVAALVIDGIYVIAFIVLVVLSVIGVVNLDEPSRDESGHVTETKSISISSLRVGDCFDNAATRSATGEESVAVQEVTVKPCGELHDFELYAEFDVSADDYPGEEALTDEANTKCPTAVVPYAGRSGRIRQASIAYFYPMERDWKLLHDRSVQCLFVFDSGPTQGSLRKQ